MAAGNFSGAFAVKLPGSDLQNSNLTLRKPHLEKGPLVGDEALPDPVMWGKLVGKYNVVPWIGKMGIEKYQYF